MSTFTQLEKIRTVIMGSSALRSVFLPASRVFTNVAGYRKLGLKTEDLFMEETPAMQLALKRLPADESYKRVYRIASAFQASLTQQLLPKEEWVEPENDTAYLLPYLLEAEAEIAERKELDNMVVKPIHH